MINNDIRRRLLNRLNLSVPGLYAALGRKRIELGYEYPLEIAAYVLAAESNIDITKFLNAEELDQVRQARSTKTPIDFKAPKSQGKSKRELTIYFDKDFIIDCPNVPAKVLSDAKKMQKVYPYFYIFENSIRYFILKTLETKYGKEWWDKKVSRKIREKVTQRQADEGRNRWHGKRGRHPIFYTNIDHLKKIITSNSDDFIGKLPDMGKPIEWLTNRIEEIELSRNIIAHNNPLTDDDLTRIMLYFRDWIKQISGP